MKSVHQKPAHLAFDGASNIAFKGMCFRILCTPSLWGLGIIMVDYLVAWWSRRFVMIDVDDDSVLSLWCASALHLTIYVNVHIVPRAFRFPFPHTIVVALSRLLRHDRPQSFHRRKKRQCKMNVRGGRLVRPWASRSKFSSAMAMTVWVYVGSRLVYHPSVIPIPQCCMFIFTDVITLSKFWWWEYTTL